MPPLPGLFGGLATYFLSGAFPSQCLFDAFLFSRFQVERVFLDLLDDVFLHHLALKATQCIFNGLTFMNPNLRHLNPPISGRLPEYQRGSRLFVLLSHAVRTMLTTSILSD